MSWNEGLGILGRPKVKLRELLLELDVLRKQSERWEEGGL